jgi:ABC-2 type transport system permease protein
MAWLTPRLRAQIGKEFLSVLRDPKTRFMLIGPPLIQLLIFGFAATLEVRNIDVAILNRDSGAMSQELMRRIEATALVQRVLTPRSQHELAALIDTQQVIAALEIPEDFSRDIAAGRPATAQLIIDGRKANAGQITLGYLNAVAGTLGAELRHASPGGTAEVRHWFNPNLIYRWFVVPSLAGTLTMFLGLMITALSISRERELGTFDQLLVSPCTSAEIIIAKTAPGVVIGAFMCSMMVTAAALIFQVPLQGSLWLLAGALLLFVLAVVGIGLMISSVSNTQQQAILGTFAVGVPMILISGFATPIENMPVFLQWLAEAMPLKHFLIIVQGSFTKALPLHDVLMNAWPMALIALFTLGSATLLTRSKLQ